MKHEPVQVWRVWMVLGKRDSHVEAKAPRPFSMLAMRATNYLPTASLLAVRVQ